MKLQFVITICLISMSQCTLAQNANIDWNANVDFAKLRHDYGARDDYDEICDGAALTKNMVIAMNTSNDDDLLRYTEARLSSCPVDIDAHLYRSAALQRKGQTKEALASGRRAMGLMKSILDSGDGKTSTTAYSVNSIREEKQVLAFFKMRMTSQALETNPYRDRLDAEEIDGSKHVVYFSLDSHFQRLARKLNMPNPAK